MKRLWPVGFYAVMISTLYRGAINGETFAANVFVLFVVIGIGGSGLALLYELSRRKLPIARRPPREPVAPKMPRLFLPVVYAVMTLIAAGVGWWGTVFSLFVLLLLIDTARHVEKVGREEEVEAAARPVRVMPAAERAR